MSMKKNYRIDHISKNTAYNRRPGLHLAPEYITIHSTGNPDSTARNERAWLTNPANGRTASWHLCVDENEAVEAIPLDEVAWHAGDGANGPGNRKSLAVEICESGDRAKTLGNAAGLVAGLLQERGWGTGRLRRHFDWSGKACPRILMANNWAGWENFKGQVQRQLDAWKNTLEQVAPALPVNTAGAGDPVVPAAPVEQAGQAGQAEHAGQAGTVAPAGPAATVEQAGPGGSVATVAPVEQAGPGGSVAPAAPAGPAATVSPANAAGPELSKEARTIPANETLPRIQRRVDGTLNGCPAAFAAYLINDTVYVPLRPLATVLAWPLEWKEGAFHLRVPGPI